MPFNMFYGIFSLMLLLHVQRVVTTYKISKSKGHGGYGYGRGWGPGNDMYTLLCSYCERHPDHPCRLRFCQRGPGFRGYSGPISVFGYGWYNPHPLEVLCYYCWYYGNFGCLRYFQC